MLFKEMKVNQLVVVKRQGGIPKEAPVYIVKIVDNVEKRVFLVPQRIPNAPEQPMAPKRLALVGFLRQKEERKFFI